LAAACTPEKIIRGNLKGNVQFAQAVGWKRHMCKSVSESVDALQCLIDVLI